MKQYFVKTIIVISIIVFSSITSTDCIFAQSENKQNVQKNNEYKEIEYSKGIKEYIYYSLKAKQLEIRWISSSKIFKILLENRDITNWIKIRTYDFYPFTPYSRIFYSEKNNDYLFLLFSSMSYPDIQEEFRYDVIRIAKDKIHYEGTFSSNKIKCDNLGDDNESAFILKNGNEYKYEYKKNHPYKVYFINDDLHIDLFDKYVYKDIIQLKKRIDYDIINEVKDKSLLIKADGFDWERTFSSNDYNRNFTLDELFKIVSNKKQDYYYDKENNIFRSSIDELFIYPKPEEIQETLEPYITLRTIEKCNDIAFYVLEFAQSYQCTNDYTNTVINLLEEVTLEFPDRIVAYLNLGDAYWQRSGEGDKRKARTAYKKYVKLMHLQQKDIKRVPARVYERIGSKNEK